MSELPNPNPDLPNTPPEGGLYDVAIIGGGPVGLAAAIACKRHGLSYVVIEKGCVVNAIFDYPTDMTFFTTAPELEIGGHPFVSPFDKPKRVDALQYYRKVTQAEALNVRQHTRALQVHAAPAGFTVEVEAKSGEREAVEARRLIVATGYYDSPVPMNIPGEEGDNVSHYYTEGHPFFGLNVTVIGAGNSAADAALDLMNAGAHVTMVVRGEGIRNTVKYWVKPNLENRIKEGRIDAYFNAQVLEILPDAVRVQQEDGAVFLLPTDFTFAMTGYLPNLDFLEGLPLETHPDACLVLSEHHESTVPGLFVAGSAGYAGRTNQVFIENGRIHAEEAVEEIARQLHG